MRTLREGAVAAAGDAIGGNADDMVTGAVDIGGRAAAQELDEDRDSGGVEDRGVGGAVVGATAVYAKGSGKLRIVYDGGGHDKEERV